MNAIEIQHLTKYYGKHRGVIDLNLSVEQGDFFGFIGPNGAGKSTTIRSLLGLISVTQGQAYIFGSKVGKSQKNILSQIGYLPSETMFYPNMRVSDILKFSADLYKEDCVEEAHILCERLQLQITRKISELSLGNRKKVGIVCAMQHNPNLYIMDEPTSGLDPLMQKEFYSLLQERNQKGATVFLSCHVLSEVQKYCKHAAVIRDGRLLIVDTVENLSATGTKHVTVRGIQTLPPLKGIENISYQDDEFQFFYKGSPTPLLQALATLSITDITINEPDLEEVFLHYYEKE